MIYKPKEFNTFCDLVAQEIFEFRALHCSKICCKISIKLEHDFFKNISKGPALLWQKQIQTIWYGLNDKKRMKNNEVILAQYFYLDP